MKVNRDLSILFNDVERCPKCKTSLDLENLEKNLVRGFSDNIGKVK
jgi:hypothetical protein